MTNKDILKNKIRVITEYLPDIYSVSLGLWVGVGSACEKTEVSGISHYIEHMLFKGTEKRTAKQIAETLESVGGQMNAFTAKEHTCYYAKCLNEDFDLALELFEDMYHNSLLDPAETEREKGVILEEINMYDDSPEDLVHDIFAEKLWGAHSYGRTTIGTRETVKNVDSNKLRQYIKGSYLPDNMVIAVAGNVKHEQVMQAVNRYFANDEGTSQADPLSAPHNHSGYTHLQKDIEQTHLCLGVPGVAEYSDDYYTANILSTILGGGVSSRLFQEAREQRGLCYTAFSYNAFYKKAGYLAAYASTSPDKFQELLSVIGSEINDIKSKSLHNGELARAKQQIKGSILLSLENTSSIMSRIGRQELALGCVDTPEEVIAKVMAVSEEDVKRLACRLLTADKLVLATVGPQQEQVNLNGLL